ncbi:MAG: prenyltransferase/squalene oxidase repeat-containing protein [Verrucomicrobiota bacterium]
MSISLELLQVARLAPQMLGESAELVQKFVRDRRSDDGGFQDRDGNSDLYYTVFGIDSYLALQMEPDRDVLLGFAGSAPRPGELDFVHLSCLATILGAARADSEIVDPVLADLEKFRAADGGYSQKLGAPESSTYGCFVAYRAYSDNGRQPPKVDALAACVAGLRLDEGGWANERSMPIPNVPSTAAGVTLSRNLQLPVADSTGEYFLSSAHRDGGFLAFPGAPMPDLLSTAVALHALDGLQVDFSPHKESCLDFVDSLWNAEGGFHGNWTDDFLDLEYTYYGLLALGHLFL